MNLSGKLIKLKHGISVRTTRYRAIDHHYHVAADSVVLVLSVEHISGHHSMWTILTGNSIAYAHYMINDHATEL